MTNISPTLHRAFTISSEYELLTSHLSALLLAFSPPFIFIHDPENGRITSAIIRSTLHNLMSEPTDSVQLKCACVNAVACFSPRILFDTVLNALADWTPDWQGGAQNWQGTPVAEGRRYNENFDAFVHGIQAIYANLVSESDERKGKARATELSSSHRMVLMVERAERLKDNLPELIVPLTRLSELAQVDITVIFASEVQWQDIRPPLRACPEPYYIDVPFLSKQATIDVLSSSFPPHLEDASSSQTVNPLAYHTTLQSLYTHFVATVYSICGPFTHDPLELAYITAARWPGFVQPLIDAHKDRFEENAQDEDYAEDEIAPPTEDARLRLTRLFTPSLTAALEALYPRLTSAIWWARMHAPPPDLLYMQPGHAPEALLAQVALNASNLTSNATKGATEAGIEALSRMAKFVLVAAFLASTNPARSDLRMFGRGPDERAKRRKRKTGTPRKPKIGTTGTAVKIPQRLLGPTTFPLDRLIAMLGVLLEENDADSRPVAPQYTLPGEYTEMEIARVAVYANIVELASMRLLVRTSPAERLDGAHTFKCGIGYDLAVKVARGIGITLNDLIYETL